MTNTNNNLNNMMKEWENHSNVIILNTAMVKILNSPISPIKFLSVSTKFQSVAFFTETINGCRYIHGLYFYNKDGRDNALKLLEEYKYKLNKSFGYSYDFFYRGEDVTEEMIRELNNNNGDFGCWEKYFK